MRLIKLYDFNGIKGYKLGWSVFGPPLMTVYCYVIGDVMVDTGQSHLQKEACRIAGDHHIKHIYLTHHHEDHSGNAAAIKKMVNAGVYGHGITKEKLSARFKILPYQKYAWGKAAPLEIEVLPQKTQTDLGDMTGIHMPGHSKDHIVYHIKKAGVLFSGDLYLADRIKFFRADEDIGAQIQSLKNVLTLDFDTLLCSHYPKRENGKKHIEKKLGFLEDLYGGIIRLWDKGVPERQIFNTLGLKENYMIKYICFGNVSMINAVRSAIRHYETNKQRIG
ncbi:MAG: MBL fold metallo-hydrolase [Proteobacteria bacterium]|nr:MBL fold metallo-hydrolase [Pseudomonadota bacterium]MBU1584810.1 MBL fold metallo-hydrolase [Pseudomonadota bacterium]MBU2452112.1 MBL fold metallo-hydrolase [Pseudomonadota bacterium]MBU2629533.1 MBL fold metallo-hydrolase [Pseudomonadota bacterium]